VKYEGGDSTGGDRTAKNRNIWTHLTFCHRKCGIVKKNQDCEQSG